MHSYLPDFVLQLIKEE